MGEMILPAHGGRSKSPVVAVIGTGYIGFQLVATFGQKYKTIAFDIREDRIKDIASLVGREPNIICSTDAAQLVNATHFLIAVPTGLSYGSKEVDISPLHAALDTVGRYAQREATVVIESSVAVGMTRKLLGPLLVTKALKGGMSPEVSSNAPNKHFSLGKKTKPTVSQASGPGTNRSTIPGNPKGHIRP
jgi:UDP-N-acetyl-D-mannosaminuronate dehydrogenase